MNANELIEFQEDNASEARANGFSDVRFMQTATMLRQQHAKTEELLDKEKIVKQQGDLLRAYAEKLEEYKAVLINIANDYPELSHDKARMQNLDHIKWAKEVLK